MWGDWGNSFFFEIRKHLPRFRLSPYSEAGGEGLLQKKFSPEVAGGLSEESLRNALFYSWILDQLPRPPVAREGRALDLGSKNFLYAPALCDYLESRFINFELTGLEIDPYRTYVDFYKRGDYGRYYADLCSKHFSPNQVSYVPGNWLVWNAPCHYDMIFCFFPFLFEDLSQNWGLKRGHFSPRRFYEKAFLQSNEVVFFHQGHEELNQSLLLIEGIGMGSIKKQMTVHDNPWMYRKYPVEVLHWIAD